MLTIKADQRRARRREAADRIYAKTLDSLEGWHLQGYMRADYEVPWWIHIKRDAGLVAYQLPKPVAREFVRLDELGEGTLRTRSAAAFRLASLLDESVTPYRQAHGQTGAKDVKVRLSWKPTRRSADMGR